MINLLPQYWQNKLRQEEMSKIAAILGIVAVFSLVLFIFMLALVRVFYYAQLESGLVVLAEKERQMAIFNVEEIEKQAVDRGNLASKIADFYAKQIKVTEVSPRWPRPCRREWFVKVWLCIAERLFGGVFSRPRRAGDFQRKFGKASRF
jgi:hypothetical protein